MKTVSTKKIKIEKLIVGATKAVWKKPCHFSYLGVVDVIDPRVSSAKSYNLLCHQWKVIDPKSMTFYFAVHNKKDNWAILGSEREFTGKYMYVPTFTATYPRKEMFDVIIETIRVALKP